MDLTKRTKDELKKMCKDKGIKGYSTKNKEELIELLQPTPAPQNVIEYVNPAPSEGKLRMIDLFAGTGAFSHAFQATNKVKVVFANDMVEQSKKMYDLNFDHTLTLEDLNKIKPEDVPPHDILTGGFPCQPFSIAGKQEGFDDKRSNVFWKILELIDYHQPKAVILENVKNLVSHDEGNTFETIKSKLEERGYHLCFKVLNTAKITGIPQHRERIYIVCVKSKAVFDTFSLDFPAVPKRPISDFIEANNAIQVSLNKQK